MLGKQIKIIKSTYSQGGFKGVLRQFAYKLLEPKNFDMSTFAKQYRFLNSYSSEIKFKPKKISDDQKKLTINWFMMDMGKSGGGDINIFRFVNGLSKLGHSMNIYIVQGSTHPTNEALKDYVTKHYGEVNANFFISDKEIMDSDACVATSWNTAYKVFEIENTKDKFYFVQDFEPYFYPHGSYYAFAENTYKMGFKGITAGYWLQDKLKNDYGMKTMGYRFTYNPKNYYEAQGIKREDFSIFFYARPVTPRRSYELGVTALNELAKLEPKIKVYLAGWDISSDMINFPHENLGVLKVSDLAELYTRCNLGLVLSATNCSLLPTELLASGCVPVIDEGPHNEWLVKDKRNGIIVKPNPVDIAKTIKHYLDNPGEIDQIRKQGKDFLEETNEEKEIKKVEEFIFESLRSN